MSLPPKVLLLCLALFLYISVLVCGYTQETEQSLSNELFRARGRRMLDIDLDDAEEDPPIKKKKPTATATATKKNQTKLIKPTTISTTGSSKNQTKLLKATSLKNQTKLIKLKLDSNSLDSPSLSSKNKTKLIKPTNSTKPTLKSSNSTKPSSKSSNSTKPSSVLSKKTSDLTKLSPPKNKTTKPPSTAKQSEIVTGVKSKNPDKIPSSDKKPKSPITQKPKQPSWIDQEDEDDLVSGFRDLPTRFQEQLLPDLERISTTSKVYLSKANKEMTKGFKPFVGNKYASTVASIVSFAFILIPLLLVSLVVNRIKAYFSVQKLVIFIQVYLSIYFSILCLSSLVTGLEPLKFFYSTSQSTYICLQVLQTLGYVLYLLLLLMYLVLVFGTDSGPGSKVLGLVQMFVGFAVGLHYYVTVFHRVVLHQPPKTNWKVHGIYATCFLAICLLANADRRKKAYLEEGGEEGKKS